MTYIDYIRRFWEQHDNCTLSTTETALYLYLLECSNRLRWPRNFTRSNDKIMSALHISYYVLKQARNRLQESGLIRFVTRNGSPETQYALTCTAADEVANEVANEVTNEVADEVSSAHYNVPANKTKTKTKTDYTPRPPEREAGRGVGKKEIQSRQTEFPTVPTPKTTPDTGCPPYVEAPFRDTFVRWLRYKQARHEPYRSAPALQLCYRKLLELSGRDPARASDIVNAAMANNYAGLYPLTRPAGNEHKNQPQHPFAQHENDNTRYRQF